MGYNNVLNSTLLLRPLWIPVIVSKRAPNPITRAKGELGTTSPERSFHPAQAKPGRFEVVSGPRWWDLTLQIKEEDLNQDKNENKQP